MLKRFATVSAFAVSLSIPTQAALANVQPIDRCPLKPQECVQTTLPELQGSRQKGQTTYTPPNRGGPTSTQGTGTRYR